MREGGRREIDTTRERESRERGNECEEECVWLCVSHVFVRERQRDRERGGRETVSQCV